MYEHCVPQTVFTLAAISFHNDQTQWFVKIHGNYKKLNFYRKQIEIVQHLSQNINFISKCTESEQM